KQEDLLLETDAPVDPDLEVTGVQKQLDGSCPILFKNVKGYPAAQAVTNLFANMDIVDRMFGWETPVARTRKLAHALTHPLPPVEMPQKDAPCQEEVITDDLEVNKHVVAIRHTELESERTIGSGNELGAAGAVQGFPIRIVKATTVDAWAVADSELVLEGHLYPRDKRYETAEAEAADKQGKFPFHPEWAGYMGKAYRAPTFHVT